MFDVDGIVVCGDEVILSVFDGFVVVDVVGFD